MINAIQIALSGLAAASKKVEAAASNIANMTTSGSLTDPDKAPYGVLTTTQQAVTDQDGNVLGVRADIVPKNTPFIPAYDPDSPFANEDGLIGVPNVNLAGEAVNLNLAEITFKANLKVIEAASDLSEDLLRVFDDRV